VSVSLNVVSVLPVIAEEGGRFRAPDVKVFGVAAVDDVGVGGLELLPQNAATHLCTLPLQEPGVGHHVVQVQLQQGVQVKAVEDPLQPRLNNVLLAMLLGT